MERVPLALKTLAVNLEWRVRDGQDVTLELAQAELDAWQWLSAFML